MTKFAKINSFEKTTLLIYYFNVFCQLQNYFNNSYLKVGG